MTSSVEGASNSLTELSECTENEENSLLQPRRSPKIHWLAVKAVISSLFVIAVLCGIALGTRQRNDKQTQVGMNVLTIPKSLQVKADKVSSNANVEHNQVNRGVLYRPVGMAEHESGCAGMLIGAIGFTSNLGILVAAANQLCSPASYSEEPPDKIVIGSTSADASDDYTNNLRDRGLLGPQCAQTISSIISLSANIAGTVSIAVADCNNETDLKSTQCAADLSGAIRAMGKMATAGSQLAIECPQGDRLNLNRGYLQCSQRLESLSWFTEKLTSNLNAAATTTCVPKPYHIGNKKANYGACVGSVLSSAGFAAAAALSMTTALEVNCPESCMQRKVLAALMEKDPRKYAQVLQRDQLLCARTSIAFVRALSVSAWKSQVAAATCQGVNTECTGAIAQIAAVLGVAAQSGTYMNEFCGTKRLCCGWKPKIPKKPGMITENVDDYYSEDSNEYTDFDSDNDDEHPSIKELRMGANIGPEYKWTCNCDASTLQALNKKKRIEEAQCARFSAQMINGLSNVATFTADAHRVCEAESKRRQAVDACTESVALSMASFAWATEGASRVANGCPKEKLTPKVKQKVLRDLFHPTGSAKERAVKRHNARARLRARWQYFECASGVNWLTKGLVLSSQAIGTAMENCNAVNSRDHTIQKLPGMPDKFYTA